MLECHSLTKRYGEKHALKGVDLQVNRGEIVALLGKNGAGKTTVMNCIAGVTSPTSGDIRFDGHSLLPESPLRRDFGILIEPVFFDYLDVADNLTLLLRASGARGRSDMSARISHMLHLVGLAGQERKKVKSFSFGMKQRLGLAQALMGPGSFLMLDEPFVGLDPPGKELFKDALVREAKENDKAVLFSSHDLADVADVCDRIVLVREGEVVYSGAYDRRRRLTVRTSAPALIPDGIAGVEARGNTLLMSDAAQMNELIVAGVFEQCRIVDIAAPDDALMALFDE